MKRYKLVRIIRGKFRSANTRWNPLKYVVGEVTSAPDLGIACYKRLKDVKRWGHIDETMNGFNGGKRVAILEVKPLGKPIVSYHLAQYQMGHIYEGGVNYPSIHVVRVVATFNNQKLTKLLDEL